MPDTVAPSDPVWLPVPELEGVGVADGGGVGVPLKLEVGVAAPLPLGEAEGVLLTLGVGVVDPLPLSVGVGELLPVPLLVPLLVRLGLTVPLGLGEAVAVPDAVGEPVAHELGELLLVLETLLPNVVEGVGVAVKEGVTDAVVVGEADMLNDPLPLAVAVPVLALLPHPAADPLADPVGASGVPVP